MLWPVVRLGLSSPPRVGPAPHRRGMVRRAGATALMLNHTLVTPRAVAAARAAGAPVLAWTVDDPADLERVVAAGVTV